MKKLRNKKTGEIQGFGNLQVYAETENTDESQLLGNFDSFEQILEYYEDYIPKEPLINDEKMRKAVKAWAEVNGIKKIIVFDCGNNAPYTPVGAVDFAENGSHLEIRFRTEERFDKDRIYTIEELCGEEKTCEN